MEPGFGVWRANMKKQARAAVAIFGGTRAFSAGEDGINRKERKERREELGWQEGVGGVLAIPRRVIPAQFSLRSLRSLRLNQRGNRKALTTKNAKNAERNLVQFSLRSLYSLRLNQQQMKDIKALCDQVRQISYAIHVYHGHGHLEKVYENALAHRLCKAGFDVKQQHPIKVYDEDGTLIGDYLADLLVAGELIVELKTAKALANEHEAQILGYLKSARLEHGLLINFGSYKFEIRKFAWSEVSASGIAGTALSLFSAIFAFFAVK